MKSQIFTKRNPLPHSNSLTCEYMGLELLRKHDLIHNFKIPKVISYGPKQLEMELIRHQRPSASQWMQFGQILAKLHSISHEYFGLDYDNYIGLNPQVNTPSYDWGDFFCVNRLKFQANLIKDQKLKDQLIEYFEIHGEKLREFLNSHDPRPSLVHGDLWSGNILFDHNSAWLIDPAPYYGDPEVDLAMTKMFDTISADFYHSYHQIRPRIAGHEQREIIYNLYHYLNHFNLFGDYYWEGVEQAMATIDML